MNSNQKLVLRGVGIGAFVTAVLLGGALFLRTPVPSGPPDSDGDGIFDVFDNCPDVADNLNDPRKCQDDFIETASIVEGKGKSIFSGRRLKITSKTSQGNVTAFPAYKLNVKSKSNQKRPEQYIIRQRCDNINLELICQGKEIDKRDIFYSPIGIGCPNPSDPFIDVVRPTPNSSNEVQCNLASHFVLTEDELGIGNGESVACTVTGTYKTVGIIDPDTFYAVQPGDVNVGCLNGNGRVRLTPVDQQIIPIPITLTASTP